MASKGQDESWTDEAICLICLNFFTDPLSLECGHNFCRSCITQFWEREDRNTCPECREVIADRTLKVNQALANLAEKARYLKLNRKGTENIRYCEEHEEELKLFCETDKTVICLVCRDAHKHREHRFLPITEAVTLYKNQMNSSLDSLRQSKTFFQIMEQQQKEKISGVREDSHSLQNHITSQFAELRQIISEKEQNLLRELREEEKKILNRMESNLQKIQENIRIIHEEIPKLKEQIFQKDSVAFFKEEARRKRRINDDIQELTIIDGALPVEKFYHPFFLDRLLREAFDAINRVSVTLDVETAHPRLEVSADRKRVRRTGNWNNLSETGKRFTNSFCVLGSEGFTTGRHYWEVDVQGIQYWHLGVAAESVEREDRVVLRPDTGFLVIERELSPLLRGHYVFAFRPSSIERVLVGPTPQRVGVYLSYEAGTVSFYNAVTRCHLFTYTGNKFTEKMYPFFLIGYDNQWLTICSSCTPCL